MAEYDIAKLMGVDFSQLPDQNTPPEYSKLINFDLGYTSSPKDMLEPLLNKIADDINTTGKLKHHSDSQAYFDNALRLIVLNLIQVWLLGSGLIN